MTDRAVRHYPHDLFKRSLPEDFRVEPGEVNHLPALIIRAVDRAFSVLIIEVEAQLIRTIRIVANPEKLSRI